MKQVKISVLVLFVMFSAVASLISCNKTDNPVIPGPTNGVAALTDDEINMLKFMREEEKLAHDVYQAFYQKYHFNVFRNITSSEQTHTEAMLGLLNQYGIADPASPQAGVFNNQDLQNLYNTLIAQGNQSLVEALKVGATIEDVDIRDLKAAIAATSKADLILVYDRLECASGNHMRAFVSNLEMQNAGYTPQFITPETYKTIIEGEHQQCGMR